MSREKRFDLKERLAKLRPLLPNGYTVIIAEKCNTNPMTVSNALSGKTRRYDIINCAIELAEENRKIVKELDRVINV